MHMDVIDLRDFYSRPLGRLARRHISDQIRLIWPDATGLRLVGLGYAVPYLRPYTESAERVLGLMPAQQGVMRWPPSGPGLTGLVEEAEMPLPDASIDRIVLVHAVETSEALGPMLREIWRVLAPGGRLLMVVPNRSGLWARRETTPFGHGRPFSRGQIKQLLRESMFSPTNWGTTLFLPPFEKRIFLRWSGLWERAGRALSPRFAGVILVEATKQIYAATPVRSSLRVGMRVRASLAGAAPVTRGDLYQQSTRLG